MRMRDLQARMTELNECKALSFHRRQELGIAPNDLKFLDNNVVLECRQSDNGEDFSVSLGGIKYCIDQEDKHSGVQAYVLLVDRENCYVNHTTVRSFMNKMNGAQPRMSEDQRFGAYWWSDSEFNNADRGAARTKTQRVDRAPWE